MVLISTLLRIAYQIKYHYQKAHIKLFTFIKIARFRQKELFLHPWVDDQVLRPQEMHK
jgi:hypothetical protein